MIEQFVDEIYQDSIGESVEMFYQKVSKLIIESNFQNMSHEVNGESFSRTKMKFIQ